MKKKRRAPAESKEALYSVKDEEFAGLYSSNQADAQLIELYDNLAVYSDYLMRLTEYQDGKVAQSSNSNELFTRDNATAMQLIKKSNDIKGRLQ